MAVGYRAINNVMDMGLISFSHDFDACAVPNFYDGLQLLLDKWDIYSLIPQYKPHHFQGNLYQQNMSVRVDQNQSERFHVCHDACKLLAL